MGFGYDDWCEVFYPTMMPNRKYLAYYSRIFNAVEIDSTFYGTPRERTVRRWAASTPRDFVFSLKAPRAITHEAGLIGVDEEMRTFVERVDLLGEKLGVILMQFPPSFGIEKLSVLETFIQKLPHDKRFAVEVRDPNWYGDQQDGSDPVLGDLLHQHGICWATTDYPGVPARIVLTSDFLYIRWIGQHGSYKTHNYERVDRGERLRDWWEYIQNYLDRIAAIYGFHNNDFAGFAPATANRFKEIAGLPTVDFKPPQQATLF